MAKLTKVAQRLFGSTAGSTQIGQFGSLAAGSPTYTSDPTVIQSLSNYLQGWFGAVIGGNSPAIEDLNAICYLYSYQLGYLMQEGIPEWDTNTVYYTNSFAQQGGLLYQSVTDSNSGNTPAPTSSSPWKLFLNNSAPTVQTFTTSGSHTYTSPVGCRAIKVTQLASGGGGGGGGAGASVAASGSPTSFILTSGGTGSAIVAGGGGGNGGSVAGNPGAGGGVPNSGIGSSIYLTAGGTGGYSTPDAALNTNNIGGFGGVSVLAGGPAGGIGAASGAAAGVNSGSGGGGGGGGSSAVGGGGGGAGGAQAFLYVLSAPITASVVIGAPAAGNTGTTSGGMSGAGITIVEEFY